MAKKIIMTDKLKSELQFIPLRNNTRVLFKQCNLYFYNFFEVQSQANRGWEYE